MDAEHIRELFREFGEVRMRRMFGGAGLYSDGVMFALLSNEMIYLKADAASAADFERENCAPFQYDTKTGRRAVMSYWRLPDRLYDDAEGLAQWARRALAVALRGSLEPKTAKKKKR